jgi:tellurium resistance protein TerZ
MRTEASLRESNLSSRDIVVGLHWTPPQQAQRGGRSPADLDAICELRDSYGHLVEIVGPGRLRSANDSVMHTGDSRSGESSWDDERIFVFLDALPGSVHSVVFTIASSSGEAFCNVPGAICHVTDSRTDECLLEVQLTTLGSATEHEVARLTRCGRAWRLTASQGMKDVGTECESASVAPLTPAKKS